MATWDLRLGALLRCAWARGVPTGQGCLRPAPPNWVPAHPQYFFLLLIIFLLEIVAGVLAYIYYQQVRGLDTQEHGGTRAQRHKHPVRWTCTRGDTYTQMCRVRRQRNTHTDTVPPPCSRANHVPSGPGGGGWVTVGVTDSRNGQPACHTQIARLGAPAGRKVSLGSGAPSPCPTPSVATW